MGSLEGGLTIDGVANSIDGSHVEVEWKGGSEGVHETRTEIRMNEVEGRRKRWVGKVVRQLGIDRGMQRDLHM